MKKPTYYNKLAQKRHYHNERRKSKKYQSDKVEKFSKHLIEVEKRIIKKRRSTIFTFLEQKGMFNNVNASNKIVFPDKFSLTKNYEVSLSKIIETIFSYETILDGEIVLSFKNCKTIELTCLFLLDNILQSIYNYKRGLQNSFKINIPNRVKIVYSNDKERNKRLCVFDERLLLNIDEEDKDLVPIYKIISTGKKTSKSYIESKKKDTTAKITNFINEKLKDSTTVEFTKTGINKLEGLISETIDNSEQHSYYRGEWCASAYFFEDTSRDIDNKVVEAQIHFFNFGSSIYESFIHKKELNKEMLDVLNETAKKISDKTQFFNNKNLFTLLSLNEGVSSLHYEDQSRGTGTVKLMESFFEIGDYEDSKRKLHPLMIILSGETLVKVDNRYKCYRSKSGKINVSLNKTKNVYDPPEKSHLINLKKPFPGTMISLRIYLNGGHLKDKLRQESHEQ